VLQAGNIPLSLITQAIQELKAKAEKLRKEKESMISAILTKKLVESRENNRHFPLGRGDPEGNSAEDIES
jgi:restriction endonuclease S subunit